MQHDGLFIIGTPRSGTTLLQSMLSAHDMFYSPPETSFFWRILPRLGPVACRDPDYIVSEKDITLVQEDMYEMTGVKIAPSALTNAGNDVKTLFENIMNSFNYSNKPFWVEKTTNHARNLLLIQSFYPRAKFIHVIRDPVDSIVSMKHLRPVNIYDLRIIYLSSYLEYARLWKKCVTATFIHPYQQNIKHIFFENLVLEPEKTLREICEFVGVTFMQKMLGDFHRQAVHLFNPERSPWQRGNLRKGLNKGAVHKWRKRATPAEVWLIQRYVKDLALSCGYYQNDLKVTTLKKLCVLLRDLAMFAISISGLELILRGMWKNLRHET